MDVAEEMLAECRTDGQSARTVPDQAVREQVRADLRRLARQAGVQVRTADLDGVVVVARLDADIWQDDTATMRAKLTPPG